MGFEVILGVVASIVTTLTGLGMVLEKNGRRLGKSSY